MPSAGSNSGPAQPAGPAPASPGPAAGQKAVRPAKLKKTSAYRGVAATENGQWRGRIRYGKYTVHLGR
jgi:hypothetical protein